MGRGFGGDGEGGVGRSSGIAGTPGAVRSHHCNQSIGDPWPDRGFAAFQTKRALKHPRVSSRAAPAAHQERPPHQRQRSQGFCAVLLNLFFFFSPESVWDKVLPASDDLLGGPGEGRENSFVHW